jgi:hypothetical protein
MDVRPDHRCHGGLEMGLNLQFTFFYVFGIKKKQQTNSDGPFMLEQYLSNYLCRKFFPGNVQRENCSNLTT